MNKLIKVVVLALVVFVLGGCAAVNKSKKDYEEYERNATKQVEGHNRAMKENEEKGVQEK